MKRFFYFLFFIFYTKVFALELIVIGAGDVSSLHYPTGANICFIINRNRDKNSVRCSSASTSGSIYNIKAIKSGRFDFAIVQNSVAFKAYNGLEEFSNFPQKDLRAVMTIFPESLTLVVSKSSEITSLAEIKNKRINLGYRYSQTKTIVDLLFEKSFLNKSMLAMATNLKIDQAIDALKNNTIDGFFILTGHPNNKIKSLMTDTDIKFINISSSDIADLDDILEDIPYLSQTIIPNGLYVGINKETYTIGVKAELVTKQSISNKVVNDVISAILDNFKKFKQMDDIYKDTYKEDALENISIPLHNAAEIYYKQNDLL